MKSAAIADAHAAEAAEWQKGGGGLVKSVDPAAKTITVANGARTLTVQTTPATKFRRYSGDSVRFEDAVGSTFVAVSAGDQLARSRDALSGWQLDHRRRNRYGLVP